MFNLCTTFCVYLKREIVKERKAWIGMKIIDTKSNVTKKRKIIIISALLVLFLFIGSSLAIAVTGSSEKDTFIIQHGSFKNGHIGGSDLGSAYNVDENLPTSYDLRTLNKVTSVKDQGNAGTCWAFATYGSLESSLLPGENWNFSENHMKNLLSPSSPEGFDFGINDSRGNDSGGIVLMSTAYLARWSGPVDENADPYSASSVYSPTEFGLQVQKHVQDVYLIPNRTGSLDNSEIKSAIMKHGALSTSMYYNSTCDNSTTYSYYYNGSSEGNHGVDIVG